MNSGRKFEQRLTMIISNHLPKTPRWLLSAVLAAGAGVLPLSVAYAQDLKAVERRLGGAVEAGELTIEQAKAMMDALRRTAGEGAAEQRNDLEGRKRRIEIAVKEGRISAEDGAKRLRYAQLQRRVEVGVEEGKITREEGEKRLIDARKRMTGGQETEQVADQGALRRRYAELQRRVEAAVTAGDLSREEAEKTLVEAREQMFRRQDAEQGPDQDALRRRYGELQRRLEAAVNSGDLSREEAEKRLIDARKRMTGGQETEQVADQGALRRRYAELQRRVEAAVTAGDLSREEAEKTLVEAREQMFRRQDAEQGPDQDALRRRYGELQRRLEAAVNSGDLSREEAEKRLIEARKRMFGRQETEQSRRRRIREER